MPEKTWLDRLPMVLATGAVLLLGTFLWLCMGFFGRDATVSGVVTLEGTAVPGARVTFVPDGGTNETPMVAQTDSSGRYELSGNVSPAVPTGKYKVAVVKKTLEDGSVPKGKELESARASANWVNQLPQAYEDYTTTPLQVVVRGGGNTLNLELKKNP